MNATTPQHLIQPAAYEISTHPEHPRLLKLSLNADALNAFLADVRDIDVQNLEYVPFMRFHLARRLKAHMGADFGQTLVNIIKDRRHGGFVLGLIEALVGLWQAEVGEVGMFWRTIVVLVVRPQGLLGQKIVEKV